MLQRTAGVIWYKSKCYGTGIRGHSAGHTLEYTSLFHCSRAAEGDWVLWSSGRQICVSCGKRCQGSRFFRPCCCWAWGLSMSCWIWVCCRTTSEQRRCLWCTPKKTPNNERSSSKSLTVAFVTVKLCGYCCDSGYDGHEMDLNGCLVFYLQLWTCVIVHFCSPYWWDLLDLCCSRTLPSQSQSVSLEYNFKYSNCNNY